jgi:protein TonB
MTSNSTYPRNGLIAIVVILIHVSLIIVLANTKAPPRSPAVVTASLLGAVAPSADSEINVSGQKPVVKQENRRAQSRRPQRKPSTVRPKPVAERQMNRPESRVEKTPNEAVATGTTILSTDTGQATGRGQTDIGSNQLGAAAQGSAGDKPAIGGATAAGGATGPSLNAAYLQNRSPRYPYRSKELREEGRVLLRVLITAQGRAGQVDIKRSSGFDRLDQAAKDAVWQWRFVPAKQSGVPVDMWYDVPIEFSLKK